MTKEEFDAAEAKRIEDMVMEEAERDPRGVALRLHRELMRAHKDLDELGDELGDTREELGEAREELEGSEVQFEEAEAEIERLNTLLALHGIVDDFPNYQR